MLLAGTAGYPPRQRRGLIVANITGYLAGLLADLRRHLCGP